MIKKFFSTLFVAILMSGCSQSALSVFGEDAIYQKGLEYTEVGEVVQSFETRAIINATYLNSTDPKKWNNGMENFLLGIYIVNDNEDEEKRYLDNDKYVLLLDGKKAKKINILDTTSYLADHIPLKNPHAKYYIVSFENSSKKNLNLEYKSISSGKVSLNFVTY